jgi:hypothetical protein
MGFRKDERSYWSYEEPGSVQLQCVQSFQLTTNNTTALSYRQAVQLKWSNENKTGEEASSSLWIRKWSGWALSFDGKKVSGLTKADLMHLAYQLAVRNEIKNRFLQKTWKDSKEVVENFKEISVTAPEGLHSQERGVSLLNQ